MIFDLLAGLGILLFIGFAIYAGYMRLIGDKKPTKDLVSNLIWWYGSAVVIGTVLTSVGTLILVFAIFIIRAMALGG